MAIVRAQSVPREPASWSTPDTSELELSYAYGDSLIEQFVLSHRPADVLKELVQNEYDAGGSRLLVHFGQDELLVSGNGASIDRAGWRRLSVMLGTGHVTGSERDRATIQPKTNGIGSKNFGMRSLFLLGNQVFVRSAGLWTVLDIDRGSQRFPSAEPSPGDGAGVQIKVPFRTERHGRLEPFDVDREQDVIASIASTLAPTLIKLADPTSRRSLHDLVLTSERCNRTLEWKQSAKILPSPMKEVEIVLRSVSVTDRQTAVTSKHRLEELEFRRSLAVPAELRDHAVPGYFRIPRGRIRIGVSLQTSRRTPRLGEVGTLFYPLGVPACSGNGVSICAPFEMNENRSDIVEPSLNSWNAWLLDEVKSFAMQLVADDWYQRFGPDAFLALRPTSPGPAGFADQIVEHLKTQGCWPSRARQEKRRPTPVRVAISGVVLPEHRELDGFFSGDSYLDEPFASNAQAVKFAMDCGARPFTLDSLIRLRCAGVDVANLKTKPASGVSAFSYKQYPQTWNNQDKQLRCASALDARPHQVTRANKEDLTAATTTLSAAGSLAAPADLWAVDPSVAEVVDVPTERRLHPTLMSSKILRGLCKVFDREAWVLEVARRAETEAIETRERESLFRFIVAEYRSLSPKTIRELRKLPILKDHRGHWVAPSSIIRRASPGASRFGEVLHFPNASYAKDPAVAETFRFKRRVDGADLIAFARVVEERPALAKDFEDSLAKFKPILTRSVLGELAAVAFLRSSAGGVERPASLYIRTERNLACLGPTASYVAGDRSALYRLLGCSEHPESTDVLRFLAELEASASAPLRPDTIYPELVRALRREHLPTRSHDDEPILWTGTQYSRPGETLVGGVHRKFFGARVPIVAPNSPALRHAYEQLGASREAAAAHWQQLIRWFAADQDEAQRRLSREEREVLREAYAHVDSLPAEIGEAGRCLLADDGTLHMPLDIRADRFLLNDDPRMANIVRSARIPVAFADDRSRSSRRFFLSIGVTSLTKARFVLKTIVGEERIPPKWMRVDSILRMFRTPDFASAVTAVAARELASLEAPLLESYRAISDMLRRADRILIVHDLQIEYLVGGNSLLVPADFHVEGDAIILKRPASKSEMWDLLAQAVASQITDDEEHGRRLSDVLYRLLTCESVAEMAFQLRRRGIEWSHSGQQADEFDLGAQLDTVDEEEVGDAFDVMKERVLERLHAKPAPSTASGTTPSGNPTNEQAEVDDAEQQAPLPPLEDVTMLEVGMEDDLPSKSVGPRIHYGASGWKPRSPKEQEADLSIGDRGEELVLRHEKERVRLLGYPEGRVEWTAKTDAGADYDIKSVDEDGGDLFIEVKSTRGRDGRFFWTIAEFERAVREGSRYAIYRVYAAASKNAEFAVVRDPIARLMRRQMRIDVDKLRAELPSQIEMTVWDVDALDQDADQS